MTPRALALQLLVEIEAGAWSDRLLQARSGRLATAGERGTLHHLVLSTLRWSGALDAVIVPHLHGDLQRLDPLVRAALRCGAAQLSVLGNEPALAVHATVEALKSTTARHASGLVNAVLRRLAAEAAPLDPTRTIPAWLWSRWRQQFGPERAAAILHAANRPARPCFIAVPGRASRAALAAELAAAGIATSLSPRHDGALLIEQGVAQQSAPFARGDLIAMDEGAALVAQLASPNDARLAVDLYAAPGGKTAWLAARHRNRWVAAEPVASRARRLAQRLRRNALGDCVQVVRADGRFPPLADRQFGTVLVDAPCSGTGTLRRRPERRSRLQPDDPSRCGALQAAILAAAARLVGPGGSLIYAVCSLEPEEGSEQINQFLAEHRDFRPVDPTRWLEPAVHAWIEADPPRLATRPDEAEVEGFVAARLMRAL